ncbi:hypothetical protein BDW74DRAFT_180141 [Aspergillus multicolor]|uniref:uncharacterized protein n=1 Tax=Aspergillus multicolor TaxID=41759 RepID=UPI003CCD92E6
MSDKGKYSCPKWDADPSHKRVTLDRRGSDSDYDPRCPGKPRPEPSYYGPNFKEIEKGRTQSFGTVTEPKMPVPYRTALEPFPPYVAKDHGAYKVHQNMYEKTNQEALKMKDPVKSATTTIAPRKNERTCTRKRSLPPNRRDTMPTCRELGD